MPIITDIFLRPNEKESLLKINSGNRDQDAETIIRRFSMQLKQALNEYETKYNNKINNIRIVSSLRNIDDIIISFKKNCNLSLRILIILSKQTTYLIVT